MTPHIPGGIVVIDDWCSDIVLDDWGRWWLLWRDYSRLLLLFVRFVVLTVDIAFMIDIRYSLRWYCYCCYYSHYSSILLLMVLTLFIYCSCCCILVVLLLIPICRYSDTWSVLLKCIEILLLLWLTLLMILLTVDILQPIDADYWSDDEEYYWRVVILQYSSWPFLLAYSGWYVMKWRISCCEGRIVDGIGWTDREVIFLRYSLLWYCSDWTVLVWRYWPIGPIIRWWRDYGGGDIIPRQWPQTLLFIRIEVLPDWLLTWWHYIYCLVLTVLTDVVIPVVLKTYWRMPSNDTMVVLLWQYYFIQWLFGCSNNCIDCYWWHCCIVLTPVMTSDYCVTTIGASYYWYCVFV